MKTGRELALSTLCCLWTASAFRHQNRATYLRTIPMTSHVSCFGGGHANERQADDAANRRNCEHLTTPVGTKPEIPRRILFDFVIRIVLSDVRHGPELTSPWLRAEFTQQRFT